MQAPNPDQNAYPTLVLSDLHLGHPDAPTPDQLRPLWQDHPHVLFNGDTAEVQIHHLKDAGRAALDQLQRLLDADGITTTLLAGNHDGILTPKRHHFFHGQHTLATHGDALHPALAPWTHRATSMAEFTLKHLQHNQHPPSTHQDADPDQHPSIPAPHLLEDRLRIANDASHIDFAEHPHPTSNRWLALRKPLMIPRVLLYWHRLPTYCVRFLERYAPESRILLFGHSHHPGVWQRDPYTLINTGSFTFPGHPRAIRVFADHLTVHRIHQRPDATYALNPEPRPPPRHPCLRRSPHRPPHPPTPRRHLRIVNP
ncbi:MAG: hypothetical protein AAGI68_13565, partial [Planctomycetota bacterium]